MIIFSAVPVSGTPESFGWLRRPDLDKAGGGEVWERPDGFLHVFAYRRVTLFKSPPRTQV